MYAVPCPYPPSPQEPPSDQQRMLVRDRSLNSCLLTQQSNRSSTYPLTSYGEGTSLAVASILAMTILGSLLSCWESTLITNLQQLTAELSTCKVGFHRTACTVHKQLNKIYSKEFSSASAGAQGTKLLLIHLYAAQISQRIPD